MQQGGSPYGAPPHPPPPQQHQPPAELSPYHQMPPEAAPPISARLPVPAGAAPNYEELRAAVAEDPLGGAGEEAGGAGISGNRWPRQETLALLKIRSDMDAAFRDATLKGPLWEEVSRKLAELGYGRSAKKCKEKFENVHKYYKRTKEGRAGRQDGKSYRFFTQLEALHNTPTSASTATAIVSSVMPTNPPISASPPAMLISRAATPPPSRPHPMQISAATPITTAPPQPPQPQSQPPMAVHENPTASTVAAAAAAGISFSSNTDTSSGSDDEEDDDEATEEGPISGGGDVGRKRKRESVGAGGIGGAGSTKMMAFFEGLMRQVMERQEAMQQRFLDAIEKREQDRMIREEAWRRQEMSRLAREHEIAAHERAAAASRDATIISFLQKVTGQTVQVPPTATAAASPIPAPVMQTPPPPQALQPQIFQPQQQTPPPAQSQPSQAHQHEIVRQPHHHTPPPQPTHQPVSSTELVVVPEPNEGSAMVLSVSQDPASSRWPKSEVHALIKLRSGLDSRYQETGPKGPLWEEISAGMQRLGYSRSAKRCKEKWENINKYFKKVKESNKKRPEDAKTCPYFHQLDALYRGKQIRNSVPSLPQRPHEPETPNPTPILMIAPPHHRQVDIESKNGIGGGAETGGGGPSNGGIGLPSFFTEATSTAAGGAGDNSGITKKPEDIVKELMGHSNDYGDSDNMDDIDDDDDDDDEDDEGQYRIQFQRPAIGNNTAAPSGPAAAPPNANTTTAAGGKASGSFLAMVR